MHIFSYDWKICAKNLVVSQIIRTFAAAFRARCVRTRALMYNNLNLKSKNSMIIVPVKEGENIEKALKKFKRKFEKTGIVKELRRRQQFDKPSVLKRLKMEHAVYVQKLRATEE